MFSTHIFLENAAVRYFAISIHQQTGGKMQIKCKMICNYEKFDKLCSINNPLKIDFDIIFFITKGSSDDLKNFSCKGHPNIICSLFRTGLLVQKQL